MIGNIRLAELLIQYGADPFMKSNQGSSMLHVAAHSDQPASLVFFKKKGLDINQKDHQGITALHWACTSGAETAVAYLLAWNIDVNCQDIDGITPLHLAVKATDEIKSTRSVKHLLIKGAK
jgi:ankyrin repeat protein